MSGVFGIGWWSDTSLRSGLVEWLFFWVWLCGYSKDLRIWFFVTSGGTTYVPKDLKGMEQKRKTREIIHEHARTNGKTKNKQIEEFMGRQLVVFRTSGLQTGLRVQDVSRVRVVNFSERKEDLTVYDCIVVGCASHCFPIKGDGVHNCSPLLVGSTSKEIHKHAWILQVKGRNWTHVFGQGLFNVWGDSIWGALVNQITSIAWGYNGMLIIGW